MSLCPQAFSSVPRLAGMNKVVISIPRNPPNEKGLTVNYVSIANPDRMEEDATRSPPTLINLHNAGALCANPS
jgi:hypothetical protein